MLAMLGKWATSHERVFFRGQELLLNFAAWIDLTSNTDKESFTSNCKTQLMERDAFLPCGALFVCTLYSVLGTVMHLCILCLGIYQ